MAALIKSTRCSSACCNIVFAVIGELAAIISTVASAAAATAAVATAAATAAAAASIAAIGNLRCGGSIGGAKPRLVSRDARARLADRAEAEHL